jgi:histidyl-tRNA synthetase
MPKAIKGTRDILPDEIPKWHAVEQAAREVFALYGFEEIRTPVFEETELFVRSIGESTDIVEKEMYTFRDKSEHSITLRPEMTAPVVRAYIEHHLDQSQQVQKLYYIGPMFRYERPQKGRYRQFHQIGAEVLGSDHPAIEAEVIEMLHILLKRVGLSDSKLLVNSIGCARCRPEFLKALRSAVEAASGELCHDCIRRIQTNVLRVLDCKVPECQPIIEGLPTVVNYLCPECADHFNQFRHYLDQKLIPYQVTPRLVRGLDYYVRTTFEITSGALGSQNALLGGGRYDGLAEMLGGPPTSGFGFALGLDRFVLAMSESAVGSFRRRPLVAILPLGGVALEKAMGLAGQLRKKGVRCHLDHEPRSLKAHLRNANRLEAAFSLIIGENEMQQGLFQLKNMQDGSQFNLNEAELVGFLVERSGQ